MGRIADVCDGVRQRKNPSVSSLKVETPFLERAREGVYDDSGETEQERITKGEKSHRHSRRGAMPILFVRLILVRENDSRLNAASSSREKLSRLHQ